MTKREHAFYITTGAVACGVIVAAGIIGVAAIAMVIGAN